MERASNGFEDRDGFIRAMRIVAASVTVVTTEGQGARHGATVSAFTSVSADPPTVLICLHAGSRIAERIAANGRFCVNVLPEHGQDIADRFAGRHDDRCTDRFEGVRYTDGGGFGPQIAGATVFACELDKLVRSGSHQIALGHVRHVTTGEAAPLAYLDGGYRRLIRAKAPLQHAGH